MKSGGEVSHGFLPVWGMAGLEPRLAANVDAAVRPVHPAAPAGSRRLVELGNLAWIHGLDGCAGCEQLAHRDGLVAALLELRAEHSERRAGRPCVRATVGAHD